ncbi:tRNA (5-methylaminomethyl-2-thiouridine)(34)-methyltransferase MnmD [soil metagenome]|jgi:tRNA U34 5-methylaminomethyl-2-thiouridine-forming methyltransferase MnmC
MAGVINIKSVQSQINNRCNHIKTMLEFVNTADGSKTIYNSVVGENYHSTHGALQESRHVFINAGLNYFSEDRPTQPSLRKEPFGPAGRALDKDEKEVSPPVGGGDLAGVKEVSILEVGFGTGLNFLLSAEVCAENGINLDYTGIEAYPLSKEMISQTGYNQYVSPEIWNGFIDSYVTSLKQTISLNTFCEMTIAPCKLQDFQSAQQYDIIYYDAFASARQPEMWEQPAISHAVEFLKPDGIFVTYAITGNLKRMLKALGCTIEKLPGALGKREMLRAVKLQ